MRMGLYQEAPLLRGAVSEGLPPKWLTDAVTFNDSSSEARVSCCIPCDKHKQVVHSAERSGKHDGDILWLRPGTPLSVRGIASEFVESLAGFFGHQGAARRGLSRGGSHPLAPGVLTPAAAVEARTKMPSLPAYIGCLNLATYPAQKKGSPDRCFP